MERYRSCEHILLTLALCVGLSSAGLAQDRLATAKAAIDVLKQGCQPTRAVQISTNAQGQMELTAHGPRGGALSGSVGATYSREDIFAIARHMSGELVQKESEAVRRCIIDNLQPMLVALEAQSGPLVVLIDSPAHMYRSGGQAAFQSNADDIWRTIAEIPVRSETGVVFPRVQKEAAGPDWNRGAYVLNPPPAVVVIHFSTFEYTRADPPEKAPDLQSNDPNQRVSQAACKLDLPEESRCSDRFFKFARDAVRQGTSLVVYSRTPRICRRPGRDDFVAHFRDRLGNPPAGGFGSVYLVDMSDFVSSNRRRRLDFQVDFARENISKVVRAALKIDALEPNDRVCTFKP